MTKVAMPFMSLTVDHLRMTYGVLFCVMVALLDTTGVTNLEYTSTPPYPL
jgi:hypothetical protein